MFNNGLKPHVLEAAVRVVRATGWVPRLAPSHICCGRPFYDVGMPDEAAGICARSSSFWPLLSRPLFLCWFWNRAACHYFATKCALCCLETRAPTSPRRVASRWRSLQGMRACPSQNPTIRSCMNIVINGPAAAPQRRRSVRICWTPVAAGWPAHLDITKRQLRCRLMSQTVSCCWSSQPSDRAPVSSPMVSVAGRRLASHLDFGLSILPKCSPISSTELADRDRDTLGLIRELVVCHTIGTSLQSWFNTTGTRQSGR